MEPVTAAPGANVLAHVEARLQPGWHLYSATTAAGVPFTAKPGGVADQVRLFQPEPKHSFDPNFKMETETFEDRVVFLLQTHLKTDARVGPAQVEYSLRYQTCNDQICMPGRQILAVTLTIKPGALDVDTPIPAGYTEVAGAVPPSAGAATQPPAAPAPPAARPAQNGGTAPRADGIATQEPVSATPPPSPSESSSAAIPPPPTPASPSAKQGLGGFLLVAFGFGLAAIFTPCVFPMIPITVSFFLNRKEATQGQNVLQALVFCFGIVVLFSGLGLLTTAVLGPFGVVQLGSSPWVNGFIALVFLAFGLSLLGAFEITVPSVILTRLNRASQSGGIAGTLVMGLTFALASFACIGPFMGTLLAASLQRGGRGPLLGMVSFSSGLALPFFLLALCPSYLRRLPKSGGWMTRVKAVMGLVILAAMLKYVTNVDQVLHWGLLTRERFLAAWIVLSIAAGLYLLGLIRLEGSGKDDTVGLGRLLAGLLFWAFAVSLIPGMLGARLGDLDAYVPAASATASPVAQDQPVWMKDQYREALERARREHKLVLVAFSGYACTNCHWMQANMFTRPEIAAALSNFVLVELYTDGTDAASQANQTLEQNRFDTVALPFYAILDSDEKVRAKFPGLTRNPKEYLAFLGSS
jgi:thiol:disulfide interchange protein DsbD